jgi:hypothetical protein
VERPMPTGTQLCCTKQILAFAAGDIAAVIAWLSQLNWVGVSTTIGVVSFNLVLAYTAARNHIRAQHLKWKRDEEEANKDSLTNQLKAARAEASHAHEEFRVATERAVAERQELMQKIGERDRQMAELLASVEKERKSLHDQRGEMQNQSMLQLSESTELRKQIGELTRELVSARRELYMAKQETKAIADETVSRVADAVKKSNNQPEPEGGAA